MNRWGNPYTEEENMILSPLYCEGGKFSAIAPVIVTMNYAAAFQSNRGTFTIIINKLLPCSLVDFRKVLEMIDMSTTAEEREKNIDIINNYINSAIWAAKDEKRRTEAAATGEDWTKEDKMKDLKKIETILNKYGRLSAELVKRYGVTAEPITGAAEKKEDEKKTTGSQEKKTEQKTENQEKKEEQKKEVKTMGLNTRYFSNARNLDDVKKLFKQYARELHPDNGGDPEAFKPMMEDYRAAFNRAKSGLTPEQAAAVETPEEFADVINAVINLDGVNIEICGAWVWVSGNTYPVKETLKTAGYRFASRKKMWYYHADGWRKHGKTCNMDKIRELHGSISITGHGPGYRIGAAV